MFYNPLREVSFKGAKYSALRAPGSRNKLPRYSAAIQPYKYLVFLLAFFLIGCESNTAVPASPTLSPAPTFSNLTLNNKDIQALLVQGGDLPEGFTSDQEVTNKVPDGSNNVAQTLSPVQKTFDLRFSKDGKVAGGVSLFFFSSAAEVLTGYSQGGGNIAQRIADINTRGQTVPNLAEKNIVGVVEDKTPGQQNFEMAFMRCRVVADIQMNGISSNINLIVDYARKLG